MLHSRGAKSAGRKQLGDLTPPIEAKTVRAYSADTGDLWPEEAECTEPVPILGGFIWLAK